MKIIYLDAEYRCHLSDDGTMLEVITDVFDNIHDAAIGNYIFIPKGAVKPNGVISAVDFIQCFNHERVIGVNGGYDEADSKATQELADLIEQIYEEDLEMFDA